MSNQFPQREKTILDDPRLRLLADPLPTGTGRPTCKFYTPMSNKIRMDIYSNLPNTKNNGLIRADISYDAFFQYVELLRKLADPTTPNETYWAATHEDFTFFNQKRSDTKQVIYRIVMGKDERGHIFISLSTPQTEDVKIRFFFEAPYLVSIKAVGGSVEISTAQISANATLAWCNTMSEYMTSITRLNWVEKVPNGNNNRGGNGGGNNRGGGYGGNNNNGGGYGGNGGGNSAPDSDLPF